MPKAAVSTSKRGHQEKPRRRAKKNPEAPKRALSAYMFFANFQRDKVRSENPDATFGEVGKLLGQKWRELDQKQRAPYEAQAAKDKERYEADKRQWLASQREESC